MQKPLEKCEKCERTIGKLEAAYIWNDSVVCQECHKRLSSSETDVDQEALDSLTAEEIGEQLRREPPSIEEIEEQLRRDELRKLNGGSSVQLARYVGGENMFSGSMIAVVKLAMRAIQELGWKLENANENLGLVTFETGMSLGSWSGVSCSLNIEEISANRFRVTGTGKQNVRGGQLIAINFGGEANSKAQGAIVKMKELAS